MVTCNLHGPSQRYSTIHKKNIFSLFNKCNSVSSWSFCWCLRIMTVSKIICKSTNTKKMNLRNCAFFLVLSYRGLLANKKPFGYTLDKTTELQTPKQTECVSTKCYTFGYTTPAQNARQRKIKGAFSLNWGKKILNIKQYNVYNWN